MSAKPTYEELERRVQELEKALDGDGAKGQVFPDANLGQSGTLHRTLVEAIPDLVWLKDVKGQYISCNHAFERFFGAKEAEIIGMTDYDFVSTEMADSFRHLDRKVMQANSPHTNEEWLTFAEGGYRGLFETIKAPLHDPEGRLIGVLGVARDITHRQQAEKDLRESEERFRSLHNASFGGIAIHDNGVILECNQGLAVISGFSVAELVGMDGLQLIAEQSRDLVRHNIRLGYELPYDVVGLRKDGSEYPARLEGKNVPYKGRQVRTVEFRDVTELKGVEENQKRLQEQLNQAQKMESVGLLAGGIAHDFNNLLQVILGYGEIVREGLTSDSPVHPSLDQIMKAGHRARNLITQLLAFSRRQVLEVADVDLNTTVGDMLQLLRRVIGEHVELRFHRGHDLGVVRADSGQIGQILTNLCVNARDAMPGGGTITIETENVLIDSSYCESRFWVEPGRYVLLSVTDTGCGMDHAVQSQAFEPFFTTKEVGEGSGLGLSTVYGLVKQHRGFVHVYSEVDKGTTFKIYLPLAERRAETVGSKLKGPVRVGNETILLAEDDPMVRDLTCTLLERSGYTILAAADGNEALAIFEENADRIDMLLLDVIMPGLGGRAVFDAIRQVRPDIPALFASGYSMNAIHTDFVLDEGLTLIQKPAERDELLRKVREVLDQARP
jgi:PAS domain S-box-containing protein|nr:PAS domain S-box protein [Candidatus Krumholzibacteria bacterium]